MLEISLSLSLSLSLSSFLPVYNILYFKFVTVRNSFSDTFCIQSHANKTCVNSTLSLSPVSLSLSLSLSSLSLSRTFKCFILQTLLVKLVQEAIIRRYEVIQCMQFHLLKTKIRSPFFVMPQNSKTKRQFFIQQIVDLGCNFYIERIDFKYTIIFITTLSNKYFLVYLQQIKMIKRQVERKFLYIHF